MSTIPSVEAMLLQVHQSLGCEPYQTKQKNNFATGQGRLKGHFEMGTEILHSIFDVLDIDPQSRLDLLGNLQNLGDAHKDIELKTWTFAADQRQILWMLLGYFYVPGLARFSAFWSFEGGLDKGMPGGRFWYLPELREVDGKPDLYMPVAQVIDWLLDLLGMSLEEFADNRSENTKEATDNLKRSLYNWRNETTPSPASFLKYFSDDVVMPFQGTFVLDGSLSWAEQFTEALIFVKRKQLTVQTLRQEIPMTQAGRLETVLDGSAEDSEKKYFVECLADRYAQPTPRLIRQRLLFARMIQDGYVRLLKLLFPGVDRLCTDEKKNKLLQLIGLYKYVYNLTIDAAINCKHQGAEAENAWFEERIPPWHAHSLLLSILPSQRAHANSDIALFFTRHFAETQSGAALEDHFELGSESAPTIIQRNLERMKVIVEESEAERELVKRLKTASPWRTLQEESRYWVISQICQHKELGPKVLQSAIQRLREVAKTPSELMGAILLELDGYLNNERSSRNKDARTKVQAIIEQAEANPDYELWKAAILQYKAKHLLACNDFEGAGKLFRASLEAGRERCYGPLRGEVARDCLAVEVANRMLIVGNQEKYYREMLAGNIIQVNENMEVPRLEDIARESSEYFWGALYKPYPGESVQKPLAQEKFKKAFEELAPLLINGDQSDMQDWVRVNRHILNSSMPDVQGDSVLMLLIKMYLSIKGRMPPLLVERWRKFIVMLVQNAPKQLNISDFKGQTPLMMIAEAGDTELVRIMLQSGADPEQQDWHGMTALHSAIKARVDSCVDALLDHPVRLNRVTEDGQSPLHTAAWAPNLHAVNRLLQLKPKLAWQRNIHNQTPLERIEYLIETPDALQMLNEHLKKEGRPRVLKSELESIVSVLEMAAAPVENS